MLDHERPILFIVFALPLSGAEGNLQFFQGYFVFVVGPSRGKALMLCQLCAAPSVR